MPFLKRSQPLDAAARQALALEGSNRLYSIGSRHKLLQNYCSRTACLSHKLR
jgi:hypothetical protein